MRGSGKDGKYGVGSMSFFSTQSRKGSLESLEPKAWGLSDSYNANSGKGSALFQFAIQVR
jgi:hypothetical protein